MTTLDSCRIGAPAPALLMKRPRNATVHECEQPEGVCPVTELREALAREAALLRERDALIERQETLSRESDHRFLNNLQMVSSLLSMQGRAAANPEAASAFALAADRVSTIGRIHRHLHSVDNVEAVAFKRFTEELSRDVMGMMSLEECAARAIIIEGDELELPTTIGIPLGFIVSELITNAVKYGQGAITVRLGPDPRKGWTLSVENRGPPLPEGFDPAQSKGFGMRIIRSFVATIGGQLCIGRDEHDQGARFTVLFAGA
jgi:two-component system, sensor histidine kinase PdtaS